VRDVAQALLQLLDSGQRGALATVVRTSGSTPQIAGARLLLRADGSFAGTVGGGAIERVVLDALQEALRTGTRQVLVRELGYDLGMCCGGRMEVLIEPIEALPRLTIYGAGHVAKPTAALALSVGFEVRVVDERVELATPERFAGCEIELTDPVSSLRRDQLTLRDWLLIVTHDHRLDEQLLLLALRQESRYIGLIGSQRKVFRALQRVAAMEDVGDLARVYAPVGLRLGAIGPDEIAVSVVSELIALRRGAPVPHMRAVDDVRLRRSLPGQLAQLEPETAEQPPPESVPRPLDTTRSARTPEHGLDALAERVRRDLRLLNYPQRDWLAPRARARHDADRDTAIYDVIIVGAGQGGLAAAFGLMRERVRNLLVVDQNPLDRAGPWLNFARMHTLRTPKHVTGPDGGIPSLTPQAFYEAQHGPGSWDAVGLLPKETWAAYLAWYRRTLEIPVRADTRVGALRWDADERAWLVPCVGAREQPANQASQTLCARRVVLATGIEGSGQWEVPRLISESLPAHVYAHTHAAIDFAALRGKRVAVLGAGASAFDNAAMALEHGASEVRVHFRRAELVRVNAYRWAEFVGYLRHFGELPDADKWRFTSQILRMGQLPPADTLQRASRHAGFHLQAGSEWRSLGMRADTVVIDTSVGRFECDYVIVGTGFVTDLRLRPELTEIEALIARWADRYTPPAGERHEDLARHPYLGPHFEFTERKPRTAPYLEYLYNYTFGGLPSLGFGGASISGMKYSIPRLVAGITGSLFVEDRTQHYQSLCAYAEREF
jgi:xanthine/CO dehydrogenase XdhC/CoxF family maturation factor/cation diffusion facilitator CzcD-associated flavoprotein CzcO